MSTFKNVDAELLNTLVMKLSSDEQFIFELEHFIVNTLAEESKKLLDLDSGIYGAISFTTNKIFDINSFLDYYILVDGTVDFHVNNLYNTRPSDPYYYVYKTEFKYFNENTGIYALAAFHGKISNKTHKLIVGGNSLSVYVDIYLKRII